MGVFLGRKLVDLYIAVLRKVEHGIPVQGEGRPGPGPGNDLVTTFHGFFFLCFFLLRRTFFTDEDRPVDILEDILQGGWGGFGTF